ncbi:hypothetical protein ACFVDU_17660 [Streptomyces albidoflavus]
MPTPAITITAEPSGSVVAKGATDDLSASLLKHAGFRQIQDWHGLRHRLPTTTPLADKVAIATYAAEMLRAARYSVELPPSLDTAPVSTPADSFGPYTAGAAVAQITERIGAAENGAEFRQAVDHLLHPEYGVMECLREALEVAGDHVSDLDQDAYEVADQFVYAAENVSSAHTGLIETDEALRRVGDQDHPRLTASAPAPGSSVARQAALAPSPAATRSAVPPTVGGTASPSTPPVSKPNAPGPLR